MVLRPGSVMRLRDSSRDTGIPTCEAVDGILHVSELVGKDMVYVPNMPVPTIFGDSLRS